MGIVQLLKAEATAVVSVMRERSLGLVDMPSEALALPARAGGSGRPPPSTSCPDRRGAWSMVLCLLLCFLLRMRVLGLLQTSGAGQKIFREVLARKKLFLSTPVV